VCADGQCLTGCPTGSCPSGFTCDKAVCKPTAPTPTTCKADTECGAGNYCNQGTCAVDTRPKPNCSNDDQCGGTATPRKCVGGYCKYTCKDDLYCRTVDSRIGTCAKDGVCRTAAEASAACFAATDCQAGQSCIDNQCK
jgi:hypothetical protein